MSGADVLAPDETLPDPQRRSGRLRAMIGFAAPPLIAYLATHVVSLIAAERAGYRYFSAAAHSRWDSGFYEQIANGGYRMARCPPDPNAPDNPIGWCGNTGWFPLYPRLIRLTETITGWSVQQSAILVAELATVAMYLLLWWLLTRELPAAGGPGSPAGRAPWREYAILALVVVFPSAVYFDVEFPMSLTVAAALACLAAAARGRWLLAGLAGAVAAAAYPIGLAAGVAAVVVLVVRGLRHRAGWQRLVGHGVLLGALSVAGLVLALGVMRAATGHWDAFFLVQAKYGGQRFNPVQTFVYVVQQGQHNPAVLGTTPRRAHAFDVTTRAEMWSALALVLLAIAGTVVAAVRHRFAALDAGLLVFTVLAFALPLFAGTQISQYRSHALLLPGVLLLRHLPAWLLWPLAVPGTVLAYKMAVLFYSWLLM